MWWWITQVIAICGVTLIHTFNRWAGQKSLSFFIKLLVNTGAQITIAPLFIISYCLAPSFFQPWFLGTVLIAVFGFVVSIIFFKEVIIPIKVIGAVLGLIGSVLLIL